MFVKQIDMIEALRLAAVMAPNTPEPKRWEDYSPDTLQNLLDGCLFFRNEPATDNSRLEQMMPPIDKNKSGSRGSCVEDRSAVDGHPKRAKRVDKGKVMALHEAGRSNRWIADDMGLHEGTVCRVIETLWRSWGMTAVIRISGRPEEG